MATPFSNVPVLCCMSYLFIEPTTTISNQYIFLGQCNIQHIFYLSYYVYKLLIYIWYILVSRYDTLKSIFMAQSTLTFSFLMVLTFLTSSQIKFVDENRTVLGYIVPSPLHFQQPSLFSFVPKFLLTFSIAYYRYLALQTVLKSLIITLDPVFIKFLQIPWYLPFYSKGPILVLWLFYYLVM